MMARMSKPRKATGVRRASNYVPVVAGSVDHKSYPSKVSSTIGALHDVGYYQSMLSNPGNYSSDSQLDVLEVINDKIVEQSIVTDPECKSYLSVRRSDAQHGWHCASHITDPEPDCAGSPSQTLNSSPSNVCDPLECCTGFDPDTKA
jgi:hypothetical protein